MSTLENVENDNKRKEINNKPINPLTLTSD